MAAQNNELLLNHVLINLSRSLLQYVSESSPWVRTTGTDVARQIDVIAARQRQDVAEIADVLISREHAVDFGAYPTEYTDLQFLSLDRLIRGLITSQQNIERRLANAAVSLEAAGDSAAAALVRRVSGHQNDALKSLAEIGAEMKSVATVAAK